MTGNSNWLRETANHNSKILDLFAQNDERTQQFSVTLDIGDEPLYADFSKTHLTSSAIDQFIALADQQGLRGMQQRLFGAEIVNPTEERAATHSAERGSGDDIAVDNAKMLRNRMYALIGAIDSGLFGEIKHLIHIGIGGSALGPDMLCDALARNHERYDVHIVSNIDGAALEEALKSCDPQHTMIAIASKTFTTTETLRNADSALNWLRENGVDDPYGRCVALTAAPDKASEWGVDDGRILPFSETVGGRYSLWSSIGFPFALAAGPEAFDQLLAGAAAMDQHFAEADLAENIPFLAACIDLFYCRGRMAQTRAVFAYDERLRLLPDYLQQLEMESNGKSALLDGGKVTEPTAAITWGGVGTDAQHAVFQLLHQGSHEIPVEFIASSTPGHDLDAEHHAILLTNCFAQAAALMTGKSSDDQHKHYVGDRPSTTILVEDVTPAMLGALIAFYEHRVFTNAVLMGINPFDQYGVELGKAMAKAMSAEGNEQFDPSTEALMAKAGLK